MSDWESNHREVIEKYRKVLADGNFKDFSLIDQSGGWYPNTQDEVEVVLSLMNKFMKEGFTDKDEVEDVFTELLYSLSEITDSTLMKYAARELKHILAANLTFFLSYVKFKSNTLWEDAMKDIIVTADAVQLFEFVYPIWKKKETDSFSVDVDYNSFEVFMSSEALWYKNSRQEFPGEVTKLLYNKLNNVEKLLFDYADGKIQDTTTITTMANNMILI